MGSRVELFEAIRRDRRGGGVVDPGVGRPARGAPAHGAAGVGRAVAAGAQDAGAGGAAAGSGQAGDRRDAARGSGCAAQAAAYRAAGPGPAGRRARRGELSYSTVRDYVAGAARRSRSRPAARRWRRSCRRPTRRARRPRSTSPICGSTWPGCATKCFLFTLRLSYSGKAVHRVFASQGQEAFLEGHVHAFEALGGVPTGQDPLRQPASPRSRGCCSGATATGVRPVGGVPVALRVRRVLLPARASRAPTRRAGWRARAAGSAATTWSRCPRSPSLAELNALLDAVRRRTTTTAGSSGRARDASGEDFAVEAPLLRPLPAERVRDRAAVDPAGRPLRPGHGPA